MENTDTGPDFTNRDEFLDALWQSYRRVQLEEEKQARLYADRCNYPKRFDNGRDAFFAAGVPLAAKCHATMIAGGADATPATMMFLYGMRTYMGPGDNQLPMEWLDLFEHAHRKREICDRAMGAAVRVVYTSCGPSPTDKGGNHARYLTLMRNAPRDGLMLEYELERYNALPATVRLYRGSVTPDDATGAKGVSWTLQEQAARRFAGIRESVGFAMVGDSANKRIGSPRVVAADVPKGLILACAIQSLESEEFLVDFEGLEAAMMRPVTNARKPGQLDAIQYMLASMTKRLNAA